MLITRPLPLFTNGSWNTWHATTMLVRLVSITLCHSSIDMAMVGLRIVLPAAFSRMSTPPSWLTT